MDLETQGAEARAIAIAYRLERYGKLISGEAPPLAEAHDVETGAGGDGGQEKIERRWSAIGATALLGLIGMYGVAFELGIDSHAAWKRHFHHQSSSLQKSSRGEAQVP
jgi:hypothetical protein